MTLSFDSIHTYRHKEIGGFTISTGLAQLSHFDTTSRGLWLSDNTVRMLPVTRWHQPWHQRQTNNYTDICPSLIRQSLDPAKSGTISIRWQRRSRSCPDLNGVSRLRLHSTPATRDDTTPARRGFQLPMLRFNVIDALYRRVLLTFDYRAEKCSVKIILSNYYSALLLSPRQLYWLVIRQLGIELRSHFKTEDHYLSRDHRPQLLVFARWLHHLKGG